MGSGFYVRQSSVQMNFADSLIKNCTSSDYTGPDDYPGHLIYYDRASGTFVSERSHFIGNSAGYRTLFSWDQSHLLSFALRSNLLAKLAHTRF
jgi:hypothetical protein